MTQKDTISCFNLLINKLRSEPCNFKGISDYLEHQSYLRGVNFSISKRTFDRYRHDILELFNIEIKWDSHRKVYFLDMEGQQEMNVRILEAFDTYNALKGFNGFSKFIHFENRNPMGTANLYGLLNAIKNRLQVNYLYQKFWEDKPSLKLVNPYALKEFRNRWYLLGEDTAIDEIRIYGLDRLTELKITQTKFIYPADFTAEAYFGNSFGIIVQKERPVEEVVLTFAPDQGKYIKTLPWHPSQQIMADNENEFQIRLQLAVTYDLIMEILSYGAKVKVISPKGLKKEIRKRLKKTRKMYG
jgi:hypothetical protein